MGIKFEFQFLELNDEDEIIKPNRIHEQVLEEINYHPHSFSLVATPPGIFEVEYLRYG